MPYMIESFDNHKIKYTTNITDQKANDLHLTFDKPVKVLGIDGVSPNSPGFTGKLEGDGSQFINISKIDKGNGDITTINVKNEGNKAAKITNKKYTLNGDPVGNATIAMLDFESEQSSSVFVTRLDELSFKLDKVVTWIEREKIS